MTRFSTDSSQSGHRWVWVAAAAAAVVLLAAAAGAVLLVWHWLTPPITDEVRARMADPRTRAAEAERLGREGVVEALPLLGRLLQVDVAADRQAAVRALANIGDRRAIPALEQMAGDEDETVRLEVAKALDKLTAPFRPEGLGRLLQDAQPPVRAQAVSALPDGSVDPQVGAALLAAVRDPDPAVRRAAIEETARQPAPTAYDTLAAALGHDDGDVAAAAADQVGARRAELAPLAIQRCRSATEDVQLLQCARMLQRVADLQMVPAMLDLVDSATRQRRRKPVSPELIEIVTATIASLGREAAPVLVRETVLEVRGDLATDVAADAMERIGHAAAPALIEGLLAWRIYPVPEHMARWVGVLGRIGDSSARTAEVLQRVADQVAPGFENAIAQAVEDIENRTGRPLPEVSADFSLPGATPGPAAWARMGKGPINVMPAEPAGVNELPRDGVVHIELAGGITASDKPGATGSNPLVLVFTRRDGAWVTDFHGYALRYNKRTHVGRITRQSDRVLTTEILLNSDLWRHAAFAEYEIRIEAAPDGLTASFSGTCNDEPVSGQAKLTAWPQVWNDNGVPALKPGEHPRLLFRPHHVDQLRERIKTPVGRRLFQALMQRVSQGRRLYQTELNWVTNWQPGIDQAIGHGFLARIYGDRRHGERAIELIMPRTQTRPYGGEHGERLPAPMCVYPFGADLMFDDYSPQQHQQVVECAGHMRMAFTHQWGPVGVFAVSRGLLGVPGSGALMTLYEKGRAELHQPNPPPPVVTMEAETPPASFGRVEAETLSPGRLIRQWLWAGRMPSGDDDPLATLGGPEQAWVRSGQTFSHANRTYRFAPLPEDAIDGIAGITRSEYVFPPGDAADRFLLYTVIEAPSRAAVLIPERQWGHQDSRIYLNGRRVEPNSVAILERGLHRMLVDGRGSVVNPRLPAVRAGYATALWKKHRWLEREYEAGRARWRATGMRQDIAYALEMTSHGVRLALMADEARARRSGRRGGDLIWPFIAARYLCTGQGLPPDTPWGPAAEPDQWSPKQMGHRELCFMMGAGPDALRKTMAREFRRRYIEGDELRHLRCFELVGALVHYPMDLEPQAVRLPESRPEPGGSN